MWIVRVALKRPYTFIVLALLLAVVGPLAVLNSVCHNCHGHFILGIEESHDAEQSC